MSWCFDCENPNSAKVYLSIVELLDDYAQFFAPMSHRGRDR
ncbi:hypothetical protein FIU85_08930 [Roseovarius sp. THAF8]|nr:hypothetical protein FIU85_08930 [Roseovarius sp. THAF8]